MGKFITPQRALERLIEDQKSPVMARVKALRQLEHPSLNVLRRLIVKSAGKPIVPGKLFAVATLRYAEEMKLAKLRREAKPEPNENLLGL